MYYNYVPNLDGYRDILGYEGLYKINEYGSIYSYPRQGSSKNGLFLKAYNDGHGYDNLMLCKNGKTKRYKIYRLVAMTFIENKENKTHVNHKDGNTNNNHYSNLEWCSSAENVRFQKKHKDKKGSKYKGVNLINGKYWQSKICFNYKQIHIGYYKTQKLAALAYDKKAKELFGNFALTNFK